MKIDTQISNSSLTFEYYKGLLLGSSGLTSKKHFYIIISINANNQFFKKVYRFSISAAKHFSDVPQTWIPENDLANGTFVGKTYFPSTSSKT